MRVELTAVESAFVDLVLEEHAALVRQADANRDRRMAVLLTEKQIPPGRPVTRDGAALVYEDAP